MINKTLGYQPVFFTGVVEDYSSDPLQLGRVKVRAFGFHPEDKTKVPTEDLPWAIPILSPTFAAQSGVGTGAQFLGGTWVFGFFIDGADAQHPYVLGAIPNQGTNASYDPCGPGGGTNPNGTPRGNNGEFTGAPGPANERQQQAMDWFMSPEGGGYTREQAAGVVGNLMAESGPSLNPAAVGDGGRARGIAQWHPDRQANAAANGFDISTFEGGLAFVTWELNNTEAAADRALRATSTPSEAAEAFSRGFERPQNPLGGGRLENANRLFATQPYTAPAAPTGIENQNGFRDTTQNGAAGPTPPPEETGSQNKVLEASTNREKFNIANEKNGGTTKETDPHRYGSYPHTKVIKTQSGHMIAFDETANHEAVTIMHRDGSHIELGPGGGIKIKSRGDAQYVMDRNGTMMVNGRFNLSVKGSGYLYMGQEANIQVDGNGDLTFGNDVTINIAGNASINVGELAQIKAASVKLESTGAIDLVSAKGINLGTNGPLNIRASDIILHSEGDRHDYTTGDHYLTAKGDTHVRSEGDMAINPEGSLNVKSGAGSNIEAAGNLHLKGAQIHHQSQGASSASTARQAKKAVGTGMGKAGVSGKGSAGTPGRVATGPEKVYLTSQQRGAGQYGSASSSRPARNPASVRAGLDAGSPRTFVKVSDVSELVTTASKL